MTPRELQRLFQQILKASVPLVGLSGCGDTPAAPATHHRLLPTEHPFISDQMNVPVDGDGCDGDLRTLADNDANMHSSPLQLVRMNEVPFAAIDPLKAPVANPDRETCGDICGGMQRFGLGIVTLTTGQRVMVSMQAEVNDCEVYTELEPLQAACLETWSWQLNCVVEGRRPEGFALSSEAKTIDIGAYLAAVAQLEAASVPAFERLGRELAAHGAPRELIDRASQFADDEVKHTRMTSALARRYGGTPRFESLSFLDVRPLDEVLVENAIEGCVRETFGALVAHRQATLADDPVVRAAMEIIAQDETRHAAFAWEIDAWARGRLTPSTQHRVYEARAEAMQSLLSDAHEPSATARRLLGLPTSAESRALAAGLRDQLQNTTGWRSQTDATVRKSRLS